MSNRTITNIFMVPTLGIKRNILKRLGFVNAFSSDPNLPVQYEGCIYLLFRTENPANIQSFIDKEYDNTSRELVDDYNYGEYVVLVYKLRDDLKEDYELIRQGKYSEVSRDFRGFFDKKVRVQSETGTEHKISLQHRIFNKDKELKKYWEEKIGAELEPDKEVWVMYDEQKETLII